MNKKILLISHEMSYTGAPRSLLNLAKILKESGMEVNVWTLENGNFQKEFEKERIQVKVMPEVIKEDEIRQYNLIILNTFFTAHLVEKLQKITRIVGWIWRISEKPMR